MTRFKVLSTAAVLALALPMAIPTASFAAPPHGGAPHGGAPHFAGRPGGGGPAFRGGPGGGARFSGGGFRRGPGVGVAAGIAGAAIGGALASQAYYGGPGYYGPGYSYGPDYYDNGYYDDGSGVVAVAPGPDGGDSTAYCMQTYRSYDPRSGTYLGNDGYRHPCP